MWCFNVVEAWVIAIFARRALPVLDATYKSKSRSFWSVKLYGIIGSWTKLTQHVIYND